MPITKIISGGQTGADQGGLDAASDYGIPHGGWCPKGRISEDGTIPLKYELQEMTTKDYLKRTEANVVDSDATVIFTQGNLAGGSKRTVDFCEKHHKPWLHIDLDDDRSPTLILGPTDPTPFSEPIVKWLQSNDMPDQIVLNVAGSRESKSRLICHLVWLVMRDVLNNTNGFRLYGVCDEG